MEDPPLNQPFRLIKSQRGGNKLVERGYIYGVQRRAGEVTHWLCEKRGVCNAIIHTQGTEIVKLTNEHLHAPDEQAVSCCLTKISIKRRARGSQDSSHHIVGERVVTLFEGTAAKLPKLDSLKRTIQHQRVQQMAAPVQPARLEELVLPADYQQTAKGEQFLLYDSGPETQRILIFWTQRNLEMLRLSEYWLADCTFKTAPSFFTQVYVVHALRGGPHPMRMVTCCRVCSCCCPTRRRLPTGGCGTRFAYSVPLLSLGRCSWTSRRLRLTALRRCGRTHSSNTASSTSRRTYGARCRLLACKLPTARTRSSLCASESSSSRVCPAPRCTGPVCSCSGPAPDARGHRASPVLRADLHRAYSTRRHIPGAAVPYRPLELPHRGTLRAASHYQRRGAMAPQL